MAIAARRARKSLEYIAHNLDLERSVETNPVEGEGDLRRMTFEQRKAFIEQKAGIEIPVMNNCALSQEDVEGNIENFLGCAQVPVGIAGPIHMNGEHAKGSFFIPLATTEGALVASYNRGMAVLRKSGGCTVRIMDQGMQRAPVFMLPSLDEARKLSSWLEENRSVLEDVAGTTSGRIRLIDIEQYPLGRRLYIRLVFSTADAAGQNMANKAAYMVRRYVHDEYPGKISSSWLESNFATDKKHSSVNVLMTRGKKVTAEAVIPSKVLESVLRASPKKFVELAQAGFLGSFYSGSNSNGLHAANGLAALYIACGQDVANLAEGSSSIIDVHEVEGGLYIAITLPSLIVGTVGGGTGLPTQSECLSIMGCKGTGKAAKFAEICAAVVLAGEISLAGAIIAEEWTEAHESMGKNRPAEK